MLEFLWCCELWVDPNLFLIFILVRYFVLFFLNHIELYDRLLLSVREWVLIHVLLNFILLFVLGKGVSVVLNFLCFPLSTTVSLRIHQIGNRTIRILEVWSIHGSWWLLAGGSSSLWVWELQHVLEILELLVYVPMLGWGSHFTFHCSHYWLMVILHNLFITLIEIGSTHLRWHHHFALEMFVWSKHGNSGVVHGRSKTEVAASSSLVESWRELELSLSFRVELGHGFKFYRFSNFILWL